MPKHQISIQQRIYDYRTILLFRWRLIALVSVTLFAVLFTVILFLPDIYEATTTIVDYPRRVPERYVPSTVVDDPSDRLNLLKQEVLSYTRLTGIIKRFDLYPKVSRENGESAAVDLMRKQIKIETVHASSSGASSFSLTFSGTNQKTVAAVANDLANGFILKNLANRKQQVQGTSSFLRQELGKARYDLESQDAQLRAYRMSHLGEMPEQMTANLQAIGQLQVQYQSISDKIAQLENEKIMVENAPQADPALRSSFAATQEPELRNQLHQDQLQLTALLAHDTPSHPEVIDTLAKIADLKKRIASLPAVAPKPSSSISIAKARMEVIDQERARLGVEQSAVRKRLDSYQAKVDAMPLRQEQLSGLTRDYETARDHYNSLLEKSYSAEMASALEAQQDLDRFEILDRAIPPDRPISPKRRLLWVVSAVLALISGFMAAIGKEQLDNSIKSESDLLSILSHDVKLVGTISTIEAGRARREPRLLVAH